MPKRQLIVAADVRQAARSGERVIRVEAATALITAEARSVAKDLGVALVVAEEAHAAIDTPSMAAATASTAGLEAQEAAVRRAVAAHAGGEVNEAVVGEVMRRIQQRSNAQPLAAVAGPDMDLIRQCEASARLQRARVVFPDALDYRAIDAASEFKRRGWAEPVLLADPQALRAHCIEKGIGLNGVEVLDPARSPHRDAYAAALRERRPEMSLDDARKQLLDPLWYGAMMVARGDADHCIAGNLSATASVLRAALRVIGLADGIKTLSSMFFMLSPDRKRVLGFGDCGVVPEPNSEQLADIAISTAHSYAQVTGEPARVAMLSFSTRGSAKHAAAEQVAQAVQLAKAREPSLLIDGEMQFDAAFVPQVAAQKAPDSPVAGQANVFVFPSLAAGNIGYKIAERLGGYTALGPMLQGLRRPMHDLSRGCSTADVIQVTLLAIKMAAPAAASLPPAMSAPASKASQAPLTRNTGTSVKALSA